MPSLSCEPPPENSKELDLKVIEGYNQIYLVRKDSLTLQALYKRHQQRRQIERKREREKLRRERKKTQQNEAKTDQEEESSDLEDQRDNNEISVEGNLESEKLNPLEEDLKKLSANNFKKNDGKERTVFFRCGNWCYHGNLHFKSNFQNVADVPSIIPELQRHQNELSYYCTASNLMEASPYYTPLSLFTCILKNLEHEVIDDEVGNILEHWENSMKWTSDIGKSYFEMELDPKISRVGGGLEEIELLVSKTYYDNGLIMIAIYYAGTNSIYAIVLDGQGEHPLLDVRFPDISAHGQGLHLKSYTNSSNIEISSSSVPEYDMNSIRSIFRKFTLWEAKTDMEPLTLSPSEMILQQQEKQKILKEANRREEVLKQEQDKQTQPKYSIASTNYIQAYIIMKPDHFETLDTHPTSMRHVLFRFGSWCYSGCIELCPRVLLKDLPFLIPALRIQQHKLAFFSDVNTMPTNSAYSPGLQHVHKILPQIEDIIIRSEDSLLQYHEMLAKMGTDEASLKWLDDEDLAAFYEFVVDQESELESELDDVELICAKVYKPGGVCVFLIYFEHRYYALLKDSNDEQPLLDSRFPTVANRGRGYQLFQFGTGISDWETLRKVSIWEIVEESKSQDKNAIIDTFSVTDNIASASEVNLKRQSSEDEQDNSKNEDPIDSQTKFEKIQSEKKGNENQIVDVGYTLSNMTIEERKTKKEKAKKVQPKEYHQKGATNSEKEKNGLVVKQISGTQKTTEIVEGEDREDCVVDRRSSPKHSFGNLAPLGGGPKMNLGGLHHLKPLSEKTDGPGVLGLQEKLKTLQNENGGLNNIAPWDLNGRPVLRKNMVLK